MLDRPVDTRQNHSLRRVEALQHNEGFMFTPNNNDGNNGDDGVRFGAQVEFSDDEGPVITGLLMPPGVLPSNAADLHRVMVVDVSGATGITLIEQGGKTHGPFLQESPPDDATDALVNASWANVTESALTYVRIAVLKVLPTAIMAHQAGTTKAERSRMFALLARMESGGANMIGVHSDGSICHGHGHEVVGDKDSMFEGFLADKDSAQEHIDADENHEHVLVLADNVSDVFVPDGTGKCVRMMTGRVIYLGENAPVYSEGAPNQQAEKAGVIGCWLYPVAAITIPSPSDEDMVSLLIIKDFPVFTTKADSRQPGYLDIVPIESWEAMAPEGAVKGQSGPIADLIPVADANNDAVPLLNS